MPEDKFYGLYRGVVADANDPEQRGRYRVRVIGVYADDSPVETVPWAELATAFVAKDAVDLPHYEIDDRVWIMFEGGDPMYPCLMGGWASWYGDIPDLPPEQVGDYATNRRRWRRQDRKGNVIEMSELPNERHVRLQAGNASVAVSQVGDQINVVADGPINLEGSSVRVKSTNASVESDNVSLVARSRDGVGAPDGLAQVISNYETIIHGKTVIRVGQYVDGNGVPQQATVVRSVPATLQLGDANPAGSETATTLVEVDGVTVSIGSSDGCSVVNINTADGVINIAAGSGGTVNITGAAVNIG